MSDQDFDFHRPAERREAKQFEPPPWERDAFEELQRRRSQEENVSTNAPEEAVEQNPQAERGTGTSGGDPTTGEAPVAKEPIGGHQVEPPAPVKTGAQAKHQVDERVVIELMAGLKAEEPSVQPAVQWISLFSALVIAAIGTVMILWGMAALIGSRASGPTGAFGGTVLLFFGAAAIAGAVWLTVRTLRQRGVL